MNEGLEIMQIQRQGMRGSGKREGGRKRGLRKDIWKGGNISLIICSGQKR